MFLLRLRRTLLPRTLAALGAVLVLAVSLAGCSEAAAAETRTIPLTTLNNSGVTGSVVLTAVEPNRTRVEIRVDPAGHLDMPSHIHPGTCSNLVPQPKYPLQNVRDGHSTTVILASFQDLLKGDLAVNIHRSNEDLKTYTACAELK
jgi:hypothetical protein